MLLSVARSRPRRPRPGSLSPSPSPPPTFLCSARPPPRLPRPPCPIPSTRHTPQLSPLAHSSARLFTLHPLAPSSLGSTPWPPSWSAPSGHMLQTSAQTAQSRLAHHGRACPASSAAAARQLQASVGHRQRHRQRSQFQRYDDLPRRPAGCERTPLWCCQEPRPHRRSGPRESD